MDFYWIFNDKNTQNSITHVCITSVNIIKSAWCTGSFLMVLKTKSRPCGLGDLPKKNKWKRHMKTSKLSSIILGWYIARNYQNKPYIRYYKVSMTTTHGATSCVAFIILLFFLLYKDIPLIKNMYLFPSKILTFSQWSLSSFIVRVPKRIISKKDWKW